jgi:hypothetical protein
VGLEGGGDDTLEDYLGISWGRRGVLPPQEEANLVYTHLHGSVHGRVRAVRAVRVSVCGSALGSVWQCGSACVAVRQCRCGSATVCGSARGCVRQCTQQCVAMRVAVCGSAHGSVWQCAWKCMKVRVAVSGCAAVRQCAAVLQ